MNLQTILMAALIKKAKGKSFIIQKRHLYTKFEAKNAPGKTKYIEY